MGAAAERPYCAERREWTLRQYEDVRFAMRDERFSYGASASPDEDVSAMPPALQLVRARSVAISNQFLSMRAGAEHAERRQPAQAPLAAAAAAGLTAALSHRAQALLDRAAPLPEIDLVHDYAGPFTLGVTTAMLGCDPGHDVEIQRSSSDFFDSIDDHASSVVRRRGWFAVSRLADVLSAELDRKSSAPGADVLTSLARARASGRLSHEAALATAVQTAIAAENSWHALSLALRTLLLDADARAAFLARRVPARQAIDELLRLDGPVQELHYVAADDAEHDGLRIRRGDRLRLLVAAANRDPDVFPEPDKLDFNRAGRPHLAFAMGRHHCIGAELARVELEVALTAFFERFPNAAPSAIPPVWLERRCVRGLRSFRVVLA